VRPRSAQFHGDNFDSQPFFELAAAATVPPDLAQHADFSLLAHGTGHHAHPTAAAVFVAKQALLK